MRSGSLRHRVTLYDLVQTRDTTTGEAIEGWGNARARWASADGLSAREYLGNAGVVEEQAVKFMLRYDSTFAQTSKIVWDSTDYMVASLRNIEGKNKALEVVGVRRRPM